MEYNLHELAFFSNSFLLSLCTDINHGENLGKNESWENCTLWYVRCGFVGVDNRTRKNELSQNH